MLPEQTGYKEDAASGRNSPHLFDFIHKSSYAGKDDLLCPETACKTVLRRCSRQGCGHASTVL